MKKLLLKTVLGVALVFSLHAAAKAQLSVSINIGRQPAWGPTGYNHVDYYYLPDIECYYDVNSGQYIYSDGSRWIYSRALPPRYAGYNLYSGYKVVVNRPKPYLNFSRDRITYARYRNWHGGPQPMLRESRNNGNHFGNNGNRPGNGGNRPGNNGGNFNRPGGNPNPGRPQGQPNGGGHDDHGQGGRPGGNGGGHDDHGQGGRPGGNGGGHDDHGQGGGHDDHGHH